MRAFDVFAVVFLSTIVYGADDVVDVTSGPVTEKQILPSDSEEQQHQRSLFYNWDYKDLATSAFENLAAPAVGPTPLPVNQSEKCPDGWLRFADSCYWIESELLGFAKAERKCFEKQATLFVANSPDEWDAVVSHSKEAYFSWIGLVRFTHFERIEQLPRWQTIGALNPSKINWLSKPFKPLVNGWSSIANCAASYHSPSTLESASYTFFYPCTLLYHSICERNSTIINA